MTASDLIHREAKNIADAHCKHVECGKQTVPWNPRVGHTLIDCPLYVAVTVALRLARNEGMKFRTHGRLPNPGSPKAICLRVIRLEEERMEMLKALYKQL